MKHKITIEVEEGCEPRIILKKTLPKPTAGQVWSNRVGRENYLLARFGGGWQAISLTGWGTWKTLMATPVEAVEGLTFVRESLF